MCKAPSAIPSYQWGNECYGMMNLFSTFVSDDVCVCLYVCVCVYDGVPKMARYCIRFGLIEIQEIMNNFNSKRFPFLLGIYQI